MAPLVLVIDDEPQIRRVVRHALEDDGYRVLDAATGRAGLDIAAAERPDAVILDVGLPDASGADVCRDLRGFTTAPVLILSARHSDQEKVDLLNSGADDYVTKPFSQAELLARVRALLRRATVARPEASSTFVHGELSIDFSKRSVQRAGAPVHLTPIEWELLKALATSIGRVLTHQQLFRAAWHGREHGDAQQYLRVYVAHLRRKLEADPLKPRHIFTIPGVGYRFGD